MTATTPNNRTPDELQLLNDLKARVATIEALMVARSGRVPHVAVDPATLADGMDWVRSDTGEWRYRATGVTVALDARYVTVPTAWTTFSLLGTWTQTAAQQNLQYRKIGTDVEIRGCISGGVIGSGTGAAQLPAGYFPPVIVNYATTANGAFGYFDVTAGGLIRPEAGSATAFQVQCRFSTVA